MDLRTVQEKVRGSSSYCNLLQFAEDVRLTFRNAMTFNPVGHFVYTSADTLLAQFQQALYDLMVSRIGIIADMENLDSWLSTLLLRDEPTHKPLGKGKTFNMTFPRNQSTQSMSAISDGVEQPLSENEIIYPQKPAFDELEMDASLDDEDSRYASSRVSNEDSESNKLRRLNSSDSIADGSADDEDDNIVRRSYTSRACIGLPPELMSFDLDDFGKPQLGYRGAASLMQELSKSVQRLKDDLFVAEFAEPDIVITKAKQQQDHKHEVEHTSISEICRSQKVPRGKGRPPLNKKLDVKFASDVVSQSCMSMLEALARDTSDPDDQILCPLADFRPTFLEVCQFRHYQFDSLRRAKHSSASLLYHIHNPFAAHLRPVCSSCSRVIVSVRWHCYSCADFNICESCNEANVHPLHDLVPVRVTFI
jgi:hypothetical protein